MNRTRLLLLVLVGLGSIFAWQKLGGGNEPAPGPAVTVRPTAAQRALAQRSGGRRGRNAAPAVNTVEELHVAALEIGPGESRIGRNPFDFYTPPPPPPPKPKGPTPEELAAQRAAAEAARLAALRRQQEEANRPPPKPKPPAIPFTYLGYFGPERRRIAVLADGDTLINALIGEVIDGKFRLVEIGLESVSFEYIGFPDEPAAKLRVGA